VSSKTAAVRFSPHFSYFQQPKRLKKPVAKEEESDDDQMGSEGDEDVSGQIVYLI